MFFAEQSSRNGGRRQTASAGGSGAGVRNTLLRFCGLAFLVPRPVMAVRFLAVRFDGRRANRRHRGDKAGIEFSVSVCALINVRSS